MFYSEYEKCYYIEIIQWDDSTNNIIISNIVGYLIDFDHSKITQQFELQIISNYQRIKKSLYQPLHKDFEELVIFWIEKTIGNHTKAINYLTSSLVDVVPTRLLSFSNLG